MKLSLQLILETLTEYGAQLIETDGDFAFTGVQILTSPTDILEPDTLYVCTPKVLPKLKKQLFAWKPWAVDLLAYYLAEKRNPARRLWQKSTAYPSRLSANTSGSLRNS